VKPGEDTPPDAQCASCTHSPAYHDGDGGRPCRAWDPDKPDNKCACKGWKDKPAPAAPVTVVVEMPEPEEAPWT